MRSAARAALALLLVGLTACYTGPTAGSLEPIRDLRAARSPSTVFGGQISVIVDRVDVRGELIACDDEALYVRINYEDADDAYRRYDLGRISKLTVFREGSAAELGAWTGLGTLSSASHGFWLVFSAPLWLIIGSAITAAEAEARSLDIESRITLCDQSRPYARFPGGLPAAYRYRFGMGPPPGDDLDSEAPEPEPAPEPAPAPAPDAGPDVPLSPY